MGLPWTTQQRRRIVRAQTGHCYSDEAKKNVSTGAKKYWDKKVLSREHREKLSIAMKNYWKKIKMEVE